jgi:hypothetical protein
MPGLYFKLGHDRFVPHHYKCIVHQLSFDTIYFGVRLRGYHSYTLYMMGSPFSNLDTETPAVVTDFLFIIFRSPCFHDTPSSHLYCHSTVVS